MILSLKKERLSDLDRLLFDIYENHQICENNGRMSIVYKNKVCIKYIKSSVLYFNTDFFMYNDKEYIFKFISEYFDFDASINEVYYTINELLVF